MTELSQAVMIQLGPFTQASGTVQLPGSKSISNRALLLAALASGETRLQNKTVDFHDTNVIYSELDSKFYTIDEYNNIYGDYLKQGGKPLPDGFNSETISIVLDFMKN